MRFELLFEKGEETITGIKEGSKTYSIILKTNNTELHEYPYQLLLFKSSLEHSLMELVKYSHDNNLQILQRDAILVEATKENIIIYDLDIEIKEEGLRRIGTYHLLIDNPEDISSYKGKFIQDFDGFDKSEEE